MLFGYKCATTGDFIFLRNGELVNNGSIMKVNGDKCRMVEQIASTFDEPELIDTIHFHNCGTMDMFTKNSKES